MRKNIGMVLFFAFVTSFCVNESFADKGVKTEGTAGKEKAEGSHGKDKGAIEEGAGKDSTGRSQKKVEKRLNDLTAKLNLNAEQQNQIKEILIKSREDHMAAWAETKIKLKEVRRKAHAQIETLLTADQKEKFKGICKASEAQKQEEDIDEDE
ncbi:MAG: hypothetical protein B6D35_11475 [Candidatus Brocadia sp. UTAMX2]|jgi:hypothetical protein|nr:MAG: hypothetical protein B6D35_11475 [Candidatus Brocadia sp. UTAMX2]